MIKRLGLEDAAVSHSHRHSLLYVEKASLFVEDGTVIMRTVGFSDLEAGEYQIPYQIISMLALGPGTSLTHDVARICSLHDTAILFVGQDFNRFYASMPFGKALSDLARRQIQKWADPGLRSKTCRRMFELRFGEEIDENITIEALRGMEGKRAQRLYRDVAAKHEIEWRGRRYDRSNPSGADLPNRAINHASSFLRASASVAIASTNTIPQLGFIHERSNQAFMLDIADLFRLEACVDPAFRAVADAGTSTGGIGKRVRKYFNQAARELKLIDRMIGQIKLILGE